MSNNQETKKCICDSDSVTHPTYNALDDPHSIETNWHCPEHGRKSRTWLIHKTKQDYCVPCGVKETKKCCDKCKGIVRDENSFAHNYGCLKFDCDCHCTEPKAISPQGDTLEEVEKKISQMDVQTHDSLIHLCTYNAEQVSIIFGLIKDREKIIFDLIHKLQQEAETKGREAERNEIVEAIVEEKMNLELLNRAKINGKFKRLDMKESIGWNKSINNILSLLTNRGVKKCN